MNSETTYVIGVDFGTDSCRALVVDTRDGRAVASSVCYYPRWKAGRYCDPRSDRYRQHPLDYVESFETVVRDALRKAGPEVAAAVRGLSFDTTASTPVLVDRDGTPLALTPGFEECPDAMFVLWKDHTAKREADEINALAARWKTDYTAFSGGTYSAEWAWAKVLHILRTNPAVAGAAWSWVEHCDWMSGLVTGNTRPETILRSRCAAGHKAMWRAEWGGLPDGGFLAELDPRLAAMRERLYAETFTADACAGTIAPAFAERLGIPADTKVGVGSIDAHVGAVGASIAPNVLTRIIGTSTCDILVCDPAEVKETPVRGICGQVDGSVVPGLIGFEAGQSAFGDLYAWFRNLLMWTTEAFDPEHADAFADRVIPRLSDEAAAIPAGESAVLALDWMNGRRTPDADQKLTGAICGLTLGTSAFRRSRPSSCRPWPTCWACRSRWSTPTRRVRWVRRCSRLWRPASIPMWRPHSGRWGPAGAGVISPMPTGMRSIRRSTRVIASWATPWSGYDRSRTPPDEECRRRPAFSHFKTHFR